MVATALAAVALAACGGQANQPGATKAPTQSTSQQPTSAPTQAVSKATATSGPSATTTTVAPTAAATTVPTVAATAVPTIVQPTASPTKTKSAKKPTKQPIQANVKVPKGWEKFTSKSLPYAIAYPKGWKPTKKGGVSIGTSKGDEFLYVKGGHLGTFNVVSEQVPSFVDTDTYLQLSVRQIKKVAQGGVKQLGKVKVDGTQGRLIRWHIKGSKTQITQALWTKGNRGWVVTLGTKDQKDLSYFMPMFKKMLATVRTR